MIFFPDTFNDIESPSPDSVSVTVGLLVFASLIIVIGIVFAFVAIR